MNDIDLSGYAEGTGRTPIGTDNTKTFAGTFDGKNQKITNLTIDNSEADCQGLFGYVSGTVQNLGVENVSVKGGSYVGGVAGVLKGASSSIRNCYVTGSVSGTGEAVGGVVGSSDKGAAAATATPQAVSVAQILWVV